MFKNPLRAILITVTASIPLSANDTSKDIDKPLALNCPIIKGAELKTLADKGEIDLDGKSFRLVFEQEVGNSYNKRLIESQAELAEFLNKSSSTLTVTRHINSHHNAMMKSHLRRHCPYTLERSSEIVVVAIAPTS